MKSLATLTVSMFVTIDLPQSNKVGKNSLLFSTYTIRWHCCCKYSSQSLLKAQEMFRLPLHINTNKKKTFAFLLNWTGLCKRNHYWKQHWDIISNVYKMLFLIFKLRYASTSCAPQQLSELNMLNTTTKQSP